MKIILDITNIDPKQIYLVTVTLPVRHCGTNTWLINHVPHAYSNYEETLQSYWCNGEQS